MSLSPLEYLRHILDEAKYLTEQANLLSREQFLKDETAKRAHRRSTQLTDHTDSA